MAGEACTTSGLAHRHETPRQPIRCKIHLRTWRETGWIAAILLALPQCRLLKVAIEILLRPSERFASQRKRQLSECLLCRVVKTFLRILFNLCVLLFCLLKKGHGILFHGSSRSQAGVVQAPHGAKGKFLGFCAHTAPDKYGTRPAHFSINVSRRIVRPSTPGRGYSGPFQGNSRQTANVCEVMKLSAAPKEARYWRSQAIRRVD